MAKKLIVEIIGDESSYLRAAQKTVATNTKLGASFKQVGLSAEKSAAVTAAAAVKAQAVQRERIAATSRLALTAPTPALKEEAFAQAAAQQAKLDRELGHVQKSARGSALATAAYGASVSGASRETGHFSEHTAVAEARLNKVVRGGLAGSGAFAALGRSLAFASTGFIAFAAGATFIRASVDAARELAIAQRQVTKQLDVGGTSWQRYGSQIDEATLKLTHLSGFTHTDLLAAFTGLFRVTGNVRQALHLDAVAANVARGRHIALSAASNALAKAAGGSFSALRRLNIIIPQGSTKMQALAFVQEKYAGQAKAGTSAQDRFNATFVATEEIIGTALLPTVTKYLNQLGNWLAKMNESGRLQRDVNRGIKDASELFHAIGDAIHGVDKVTGSFVRTLELWAAFRLVSIVAGWIGALDRLAASWVAVGGAAKTAGVAQATALEAGTVGGIAGRPSVATRAVGGELGGAAAAAGAGGLAAAVRSRLQDRRLTRNLPLVFGQYTGAANKATAATSKTAAGLNKLSSNIGLVGIAAALAIPRLQKLQHSESSIIGRHLGGTAKSAFDNVEGFFTGGAVGKNPFDALFGGDGTKTKPHPVFVKLVKAPGFDGILKAGQKGGVIPGPFGTAKPQKQFKQSFDLRSREQLAQAQAQLTQTTADDVRSAKQIAARIKRLIDQGRLHGQALIQALGLEASALSTIWSAEDAAAQKRAQKAQAAKERIQRQLENSIDPLKLEIALSRAEAFGKPILPHLRALLHAAQRALAKGLTGALEKQALDQIASLKQQIKDATTTATVTFTPSAKLQLALARDEALGLSPVHDLLKLRAAILKFIHTHKKNTAALIDAYGQLGAVTQQLAEFTLSPRLQLALARDAALGIDPTKDLLKARRALLRFIRTHKKNFAALTDAYNQLADINQQIGSSASSALGLFKQASTAALTAGLGLTPEQREKIRARLSQLGPGQTVPGSGTGAGGFAIDPNTGRPLVLNDRRRSGRGDGTGGGGSSKIKVENKIDLNVYIDGKHVEATVTKRQMKRRRLNPHQRRGPNAG